MSDEDVTHEEMQDIYELYALGVLEEEERAEISQHLASGCAVCLGAVKRAAMQNAGVLAAMTPDSAPPRRVGARLREGVGIRARGWTWAAWVAAAACLVAMAWSGLRSWRMAQDLEATRREVQRTDLELARMRAVLDVLNAPGTRAVSFGQEKQMPPRGSVFVNPQKGVVLIASHLPQLSAGWAYEMWVIPKTGAPKPAGVFWATEGGTAVHTLQGPLDVASTGAVAVTVEPDKGSNAPTSKPIIVASL